MGIVEADYEKSRLDIFSDVASFMKSQPGYTYRADLANSVEEALMRMLEFNIEDRRWARAIQISSSSFPRQYAYLSDVEFTAVYNELFNLVRMPGASTNFWKPQVTVKPFDRPALQRYQGSIVVYSGKPVHHHNTALENMQKEEKLRNGKGSMAVPQHLKRRKKKYQICT
jgi:hypothetical protein